MDQFYQGTANLLLEDQFYVMPGPQGFMLAQVFAFPFKDQQLWLHSVHNTRTWGHELLHPHPDDQ